MREACSEGVRLLGESERQGIRCNLKIWGIGMLDDGDVRYTRGMVGTLLHG